LRPTPVYSDPIGLRWAEFLIELRVELGKADGNIRRCGKKRPLLVPREGDLGYVSKLTNNP